MNKYKLKLFKYIRFYLCIDNLYKMLNWFFDIILYLFTEHAVPNRRYYGDLLYTSGNCNLNTDYFPMLIATIIFICYGW